MCTECREAAHLLTKRTGVLVCCFINMKSTKVQTLGTNIWACARAQAFENANALTTMCEYTEGCGAKTETRTAVYKQYVVCTSQHLHIHEVNYSVLILSLIRCSYTIIYRLHIHWQYTQHTTKSTRHECMQLHVYHTCILYIHT